MKSGKRYAITSMEARRAGTLALGGKGKVSVAEAVLATFVAKGD